MKNLFRGKDLEELLSRLENLTPDLKPKWGKMNTHQAVVHLTDPFRTALGEKPVEYAESPFSKFPVNLLVSQFLPWPQGATTAPEFIQGDKGSQPTEFENDKKLLREIMKRFAENEKPFRRNPSFGNLSNKQWARVMWRHVDHHLRQFGL